MLLPGVVTGVNGIQPTLRQFEKTRVSTGFESDRTMFEHTDGHRVTADTEEKRERAFENASFLNVSVTL